MIRAEAAQAGATIYFGDEVASTGVRHAVNIISAIVPKGKLHSKPLPALEAVKPSDSTDEVWIERRAQPDRESVSAVRMTYDESLRMRCAAFSAPASSCSLLQDGRSEDRPRRLIGCCAPA